MNSPTPSNDVMQEIPWLPLSPPLRSEPGHRNADIYRAILEQFDVEHNPRYVPRDEKTYCNIFVWDVTRAMGAELPHWVNSGGTPTRHDDPDGRRLNCNAMHEWLQSFGPQYGWRHTDLTGALTSAAQGRPTIAIHKNPDGNGHIVMIRPDGTGFAGPLCAQAGKLCLQRGRLAEAFGDQVPEYWSHD